MCRSIAEGGRRCKCASGKARRAADRARYAAKQAEPGALQLPAPAEPASEPWPESLAEINELLDSIRTKEQIVHIVTTGTYLETGDFIPMEMRTIDAVREIEPDFPDSEEMFTRASEYMQEIDVERREIGHAINAEALRRCGPKPQDTPEFVELQARAEELKSAVGAKYTEWQSAERESPEWETLWGEHKAMWGELNELRSQIKAAVHGDLELGIEGWQAKYAEACREVLAEVRPMGLPEEGLKLHHDVDKKVAAIVSDAARFFPTDWIERSNTGGNPLFARFTSARAHYCEKDTRNVTVPGAEAKKTKVKLPEISEERRFMSEKGYLNHCEDWDHLVGEKATIRVRCPITGRRTKKKLLRVEKRPEEFELTLVYDGGATTVETTKDGSDNRDLPEGTKMLPHAEFLEMANGRLLRSYKGDERVVARSSYTEEQRVVRNEYEDGTVQHIASELPPPAERTKKRDVVAILTTDFSPRCTVHELTHRMEDVVPGLAEAENRFWKERCTDDGGAPLPGKKYGTSRGRTEIVHPDAGFVEAYSTKRYDGRYFELLSTGTEAIFGQSRQMGSLAGVSLNDEKPSDPDHAAFTLGVMASV